MELVVMQHMVLNPPPKPTSTLTIPCVSSKKKKIWKRQVQVKDIIIMLPDIQWVPALIINTVLQESSIPLWQRLWVWVFWSLGCCCIGRLHHSFFWMILNAMSNFSLLIGLTLAVDPDFKVLFVVIVFHRMSLFFLHLPQSPLTFHPTEMFEGLGVGSRLAYLDLPPKYSYVPIVGGILYGITTPIGQSIVVWHLIDGWLMVFE